MRLKLLERQRIREAKFKEKEEALQAKVIEAQKIRDDRERERQEQNRAAKKKR